MVKSRNPLTLSVASNGWLPARHRSEEHTSELQSQSNLVCRLLLEKKKHLLRHASALRSHRPRAVPSDHSNCPALCYYALLFDMLAVCFSTTSASPTQCAPSWPVSR